MCVVHAFCAHVRTARLMISMDWLVQLVSCFWLMCLGPHLHLMRQMTPVASVGDMANSSNHLKPLIHVIINDIQ